MRQISRRRFRTCGASWGAEGWQGWISWGWSASSSMASHASCGTHHTAGLSARSTVNSFRGRPSSLRGKTPRGPISAAAIAAYGSSAVWRGGCRGCSASGWMWSLKMLIEATQLTQEILSNGMLLSGGGSLGAGPCWPLGSSCDPWRLHGAVRGLRQGACPVRRGAPRCGLLRGERAFAVEHGEWGSLP